MTEEYLAGGAFVPKNADELSDPQKKTVCRILEAVRRVTLHEAERHSGEVDPNNQALRRPRHVYLVDGARGAGKTTVLLTLQALISQIGRGDAADEDSRRLIEELFKESKPAQLGMARSSAEPSVDDGMLLTAIERIVSGGDADASKLRRVIGILNKQPDAGELAAASASAILAKIKAGSAALTCPVCVLRTVFPARINSGESIIEAVFSRIRDCIMEETNVRQRNEDPQKRKELLKELDENVAGAWRLSRPEGRDAIQRDSFNVENFLDLSAKYDSQRQNRESNWRKFVDSLLNYLDAQILGLFFDDTDTDPRENSELLNTIRLFFDHPRIVTVVAGNLKSIRRSLVVHHGSVEPGSQDFLATRSGEELDRAVEEYLEKVLPPPNRHYVGPTGLGHARSGLAKRGADSVFSAPFDKYCLNRLGQTRMGLLLAKLRTARGSPEPPEDFRGTLKFSEGVTRRGTIFIAEDYTSWWLLRHFYTEALAPRTMRQLAHMERYVRGDRDGEPGISAIAQRDSPKRLPVMLFEMSENARLIRRFGDADRNVLDWLHRQVVSCSWTGDRYFKINDDRFYDSGFEFHFICFRIDLGIAAPILNNPEEDVPSGLLPFPRLPSADLTGYPLTRAFDNAMAQRRYGVSKWIDHPAVPLNCMYMFDLTALNQWVWNETIFAPGPRNGSLLWAPSDIHRHCDYVGAWNNAVLDDPEAFNDVRSYWDLHIFDYVCTAAKKLKTIQADKKLEAIQAGDETPRVTEGIKSDRMEAWRAPEDRLIKLRTIRATELARRQRRAISEYVRRCVVPLAAVAQVRIEDGRPNDVSEPPDERRKFWRGPSLQTALQSLQAPLEGVEQDMALSRQEGAAPETPSAALRARAWSDLGAAARDFGRVPATLQGRVTPFAAMLNDLLGAHMAVRAFENTVAASVKAELLPCEDASTDDKARFIRHSKPARRFLERNEEFSAMEPARIVALEDVQTLLSHMGRMGVLAPQSHIDLARMCVAMRIDGKLERADAGHWQRGLQCFIVRTLLEKEQRNALVTCMSVSSALSKAISRRPDPEVIGYDVPISKQRKNDPKSNEEIPEAVISLVTKLFKIDPAKATNTGVEIWQQMLALCGKNLVGERSRDLVDKREADSTRAGYWMWPEFFEFAYRARVARALLLFLYAFAPYMRSLYEVDREAFLSSAKGSEVRRVKAWMNSGRPLMWAEAAAKMRNFVRRFGDVLRLARLRLELRAFAYGDGESTGNPALAEQIEKLLKVNEKDKFKNKGGITFIHMPDFSHRTLGVNVGTEGHVDSLGILQRTFEAVGAFFEFVYPDVPPAHWPTETGVLPKTRTPRQPAKKKTHKNKTPGRKTPPAPNP